MGREYLLIGALLVVAVGVAMLAGTGAAMLEAKRTGKLPGDDKELATPVASPGVLVRLTVGVVITAVGGWAVWAYFA